MNRKGWSVNLLIAFAWTMGFVISVPMNFDAPGFAHWSEIMTGNKTNNDERTQCLPPWDTKSVGYTEYNSIVQILIPAIVLIVTQVLIYVKLNKRQKKRLHAAQQEVI